ncbi:MAG: VapC toxin family PIN domain ribonuclease [Leptolyngbya foveolarum]|uniref:VapC toxin family PIN domain ribonuclease n=1 Tax=Leptolyngbya foveolarum TaxID=47253 RepID=A0A2W4U080_9CYAN|nr:MAG: VapC toxin family PIN domain ribonuclease [Leptolyngbya foveolarum]
MIADPLIDSGFLYAVMDSNDERHAKVIEALLSLRGKNIVLINAVIVETAYLLSERIGQSQMRCFLEMISGSQFKFEYVKQSDINRIREILEKYEDAKLDFTDAAITAIAERLNVRQILTVDRRDFGMIRPNHCEYFEILPS